MRGKVHKQIRELQAKRRAGGKGGDKRGGRERREAGEGKKNNDRDNQEIKDREHSGG